MKIFEQGKGQKEGNFFNKRVEIPLDLWRERMKKILLIIFVFSFLYSEGTEIEVPRIDWVKYYSLEGWYPRKTYLVKDNAGYFYIGCSVFTWDIDYEKVSLLKVSSDGSFIWRVEFYETDKKMRVNKVLIGPDGKIYICGSFKVVSGPLEGRIGGFLLVYNDQGILDYSYFELRANADIYYIDMAFNGNYLYIGGSMFRGVRGYDYIIRRLDIENLTWVRRWIDRDFTHDLFRRLSVSTNYLYVTGFSCPLNTLTGGGIYTVMLEIPSLTLTAETFHTYADYELAGDMIVNRAGNIAICGTSIYEAVVGTSPDMEDFVNYYLWSPDSVFLVSQITPLQVQESKLTFLLYSSDLSNLIYFDEYYRSVQDASVLIREGKNRVFFVGFYRYVPDITRLWDIGVISVIRGNFGSPYVYDGPASSAFWGDVLSQLRVSEDGNVIFCGAGEKEYKDIPLPLLKFDLLAIKLSPHYYKKFSKPLRSWIKLKKLSGGEDIMYDFLFDENIPRSIYFAGRSSFNLIFGHLTYKIKDTLAISYNNGKNAVMRKIGFEQSQVQGIYSVFSDNDSVYFWTDEPSWMDNFPVFIGKGKFPAIAVSPSNLPAVVWLKNVVDSPYLRADTVYYSFMNPNGTWTRPFIIYARPVLPFWKPYASSPPSIIITPDDTVHIVLSLRIDYNTQRKLVEYSFPRTNPSEIKERTIFHFIPGKIALAKEFPTIAYSKPIDPTDPNDKGILHCIWTEKGEEDTPYYATRKIGEPNWEVHGDRFSSDINPEAGIKAIFPSAECYGDQIYVAYMRKDESGGYEVYKAWKNVDPAYRDFYSRNYSRTPYTYSMYPVTPRGQVAVFEDHLWFDTYPPRDIFFKINPEDNLLNPFFNISRSPARKSFSPHSYTQEFNNAGIWGTILTTSWLEETKNDYTIEILSRFIPNLLPAFRNILTGFPQASPYLIKRDTFFSDYLYPVDAGEDELIYKVPVYPDYEYEIKAVFYFESDNPNERRRVKMKIDGRKAKQTWYYANVPETLSIRVSENYAEDGYLEIAFKNKRGEYVTLAGAKIYQIEEIGHRGGPMSYKDEKSKNEIRIIGNMFKGEKVPLITGTETGKYGFEVFDILGRKRFISKAELDALRKYGSGIYFLIIRDRSGERVKTFKLIKLR